MNWQRYQGDNAWMRENVIESPEGYRIIRHNNEQFSAWQPLNGGLTMFFVANNSAAAKQMCAANSSTRPDGYNL